MKSKSLLLLFFLFNTFLMRAQSVMPDVIASSGDFFSNSNGQIQWTIGEVVVETFQNSGYTVNQGFHQVFDLNTGITVYTSSPINVYPNPVSQTVTVEFGNNQPGMICLTDITGKLLLEDKISGNYDFYKMDLGSYPAGIYILRITGNRDNSNQSFRLIKTN